MTFTDDQIRALPGAEVYGDDNLPVGTVGEIWTDPAGQPWWVSVNTSLVGRQETLMPLKDARVENGVLRTAYTKAQVAQAPAGNMNDIAELRRLYAHYGLPLNEDELATTPEATPGAGAMTRSEERLKVRLHREVTGRVRMVKHIVTEQVTITVPVRREEIRLEQVPLGADEDLPDSQGGETILYAERPVVTMETVAVERVRLGRRTVTEQQTVSGVVRKERIELDLPGQ